MNEVEINDKIERQRKLLINMEKMEVELELKTVKTNNMVFMFVKTKQHGIYSMLAENLVY